METKPKQEDGGLKRAMAETLYIETGGDGPTWGQVGTPRKAGQGASSCGHADICSTIRTGLRKVMLSDWDFKIIG